MKLILASASPRRQELLKKITEDFIVFPADIDESVPKSVSADNYAEYLAVKKAIAVFNKYPDSIVIGCDTAVILDDKILGKPKDKNEAKNMLRMLSGREHKVITGCALFCRKKSLSFSVETKVRFYELSKQEIEDYINTDEPYDKAGGYGIQGKASLFISGITGDYYNVVGLPVAALNKAMRKFEKEIL
jgi:septum formation protein